jgi:hypothetical protein
MSTQYRLVQSGKTASGGCSAGQGSSEPVAPRIYRKGNITHHRCEAQLLDAPQENNLCLRTEDHNNVINTLCGKTQLLILKQVFRIIITSL